MVDGKSTDNTLNIIYELEPLFQEKGIAVRIVSEKDKGIFDAMNKGVKLANGRWVNFMNAGDVFYNDKTIDFVFSHEIPMEVKLVYGDTLRQKSYAVVAAKGNIPEVTPKLMPACHQSMFTDVDELKSHPFDLSYRLSADYNFVYNLYKRGEKMLYIPVNISFCEAVYGVSSVNKIAVKKECARIRGVDHTLTWKIKILGKQVEYGIKQIIEYLIPASFLKEMKIRNRKRLEHRK